MINIREDIRNDQEKNLTPLQINRKRRSIANKNQNNHNGHDDDGDEFENDENKDNENNRQFEDHYEIERDQENKQKTDHGISEKNSNDGQNKGAPVSQNNGNSDNNIFRRPSVSADTGISIATTSSATGHAVSSTNANLNTNFMNQPAPTFQNNNNNNFNSGAYYNEPSIRYQQSINEGSIMQLVNASQQLFTQTAKVIQTKDFGTSQLNPEVGIKNNIHQKNEGPMNNHEQKLSIVPNNHNHENKKTTKKSTLQINRRTSATSATTDTNNNNSSHSNPSSDEYETEEEYEVSTRYNSQNKQVEQEVSIRPTQKTVLKTLNKSLAHASCVLENRSQILRKSTRRKANNNNKNLINANVKKTCEGRGNTSENSTENVNFESNSGDNNLETDKKDNGIQGIMEEKMLSAILQTYL